MRRLFAIAVLVLAGCNSNSTSGTSSGSTSSGTNAGSGSSGSSASSGTSGTNELTTSSSSGSGGSTGSTASSSSSGSTGSNGGSTGASYADVLDGTPPWTYDGGNPCEPHPPALVDLRMPSISRTVNVGATDDLQAALDAAQPGDELVLPAGATYTGNFELKPKSGTGWIVVRTSDMSSLPAFGERIDPTQVAAHLPKIVTSNSAPAITADSQAGYWRFVGVEVGFTQGVSLNYNLVLLGDGTQTSSSDLPHDIIFDRSWIHGNDTGDLRRGLALNGNSIGVVGCDVSNFHEQGADSQAAGGWNGGGPFTLVNNYFEGAGETVLFGGSDPKVPNLVPSDIVLVHNTLSKRLTWKSDDPSYAGVNYVVKNTLEFKNAKRVWVEGNLIERSWVMGQTGYLLLFTPRNQSGTAPWSGVSDVTVVNNILRHGAGGVNLLATDNDNPSQPATRIRVWNNLFYDVGSATWGAQSKTFMFGSGVSSGNSGASCIDFQHLTSDNGTATFGAAGDNGIVADKFTFSNNIVSRGHYGFFGSNVGEGNPALNTYFTNWNFAGNVVYGDGTHGLPSASSYPANNQFSTSIDTVGFADPANADYHLSSSSSYVGTATDDTDPGANIDAIEAAVQ